MSSISRVSTSLMYSILSRNVMDIQTKSADLAQKINSGRKFNSASEDPVGIIGAVTTAGRILDNNQGIRDRNTAIADLEAQEVALRTLNDLANRLNEITIKAGNDTQSADERILFRDEMRTIGETIVQVVNSQNGRKFLFSGEQSQLQTLRLNDGANFNTVVYKDNQDNGRERQIDSNFTSVSLEEELIGQPDGALLQNNVINPVATQAGNLDFQMNDGAGNLITFTANIAVADNLATIIGKINAAFTGAGGVGVIAQEAPAGYLQMDTDLATGTLQNSVARISVLSSSNIPVANELGINRQDNFGQDMGLMRTMSALETALGANNAVAIRALIDNMSFNLNQINQKQSEVGLLVAQAEKFNDTALNLDLKLQSDLSLQQDLDFIDANAKYSNLQVALQTSVNNTSKFFSQTLGDFLG